MPDLAQLNLIIQSQQVKEGREALDQLTQSGKRAEDQAVRLAHTHDSLGSATGRASDAFNAHLSVGERIGGMYLRLTGIAAGLGLTLSALAGARFAIGLAVEAEKTSLAFRTLVGNAAEAEQLLSQLRSFADTTPFEFPDLANSARLMLALGFASKDVVKDLRAVGDAVAAFGAGPEMMNRIILALGQMQQKGHVTGEDMKQLTEAGINGWGFLADAAGKSVQQIQKLAEKGAIEARSAVDVILEGLRTKYKGATENLAQTTGGLFSTLKDTSKRTFEEIGTAIIEAFNIRGFLRDAIPEVEHIGKVLVDVVRIAGGLPPKFHETAATAKEVADTLKAVLAGVGTFVALKAAIEAATIAMALFNLVANANPFGIIALGIAATVAAVVYFKDKVIDLGGESVRVGSLISAAFEVAAEDVERAMRKIDKLQARSGVPIAVNAVQGGASVLLQGASVGNAVQGAITGASGQVSRDTASAIGQAPIVAAEAGGSALSTAITGAVDLTEKGAVKIIAAIARIDSYLNSITASMLSGWGGLWDGMWQIVKRSTNFMIAALVSLGDVIKEIASRFSSLFSSVAKLDLSSFTTAKNSAIQAALDIQNALNPTNIAQAIGQKAVENFNTDYVGQFTGRMKNVGTAAGIAFSSSFSSVAQTAAQTLAATLSNSVNAATEKVKSAAQESMNFLLAVLNRVNASIAGKVSGLALSAGTNALAFPFQTVGLIGGLATQAPRAITETVTNTAADFGQRVLNRALQNESGVKTRQSGSDIDRITQETFGTGGSPDQSAPVSDFANKLKFLAPQEIIDRIKEETAQMDIQLRVIGKTDEVKQQALATFKIESELRKSGIQDQEVINRLTGEYRNKLVELQQAQKLETIATGIGNAFGEAFTNMATGAKNAKDAILDLVQAIEKLVIQQTVAALLSNAITGVITGAFAPKAAPGASNLPSPNFNGPNIVQGSISDTILTPSAYGNVFDAGDVRKVHPFAYAKGEVFSSHPDASYAKGGVVHQHRHYDSAYAAGGVVERAVVSSPPEPKTYATGGVVERMVDPSQHHYLSIKAYAKGGVVDRIQEYTDKTTTTVIRPFALGSGFSGDVVSSPTFFPMRGGQTGLMGEAGPEAIVPLARTPDGKLGVRSQGGSEKVQQTHNYYFNITTRDADSFRRSKRQILNELKSAQDR